MSGMSAVNWAAAESVGGSNEATVSLIVTGLGLIHVLQVYTSAMVTLAVWDWLVCLKMEWARIWKREWSLIKCLYLWTRYYGLLSFALNLWLFNAEFTTEQCETLHYLIAATCMWTTLGSETILAVRTYAFLGKNRLIGIALAVLLLGETAFLLYVAIAGVHQTALVMGTKGPCTASDKPGHHVVSGFWLAPVAFDIICTSLTMRKALQLKMHGIKSDIVVIFIREGLLYFVAVAAVNILNAAFMFQSNENIQNINSFLALVLSQVLCCRLALNLRRGDSQLPSHLTASGTHHSFGTPSTRLTHSGINIPLNRFKNTYGEDLYGGVKVQVDVEREAEEVAASKAFHQTGREA